MKRSVQDTPIAFVGAGNLATNLAKALYSKGFRIVQVYSRTIDAARTLAEVVEADYTDSMDEITVDARLYIVALSDSALMANVASICKGKHKGALMVHTAGSVPMNIWSGYATNYGVLYPLQTFSKGRGVDFAEIPFFVEASSDDNAELLRRIAQTLSEKVYNADSDTRKMLHLSAVFACNFTNHMYALSERLLERCGLPFDILLSLVDETARKVHELSPSKAQTGPAVRYDSQVMENHEKMLDYAPELQRIYKLLSDSIHQLAIEKDNRK
jgi:predicted short-subunit dehydrogenase-like oxidoreductase (DUF2520 family)